MLRILLLSPLPPPSGGIATWTKQYLKSKIYMHHHVDIVNTAVLGSRKKTFKKVNIFSELKRFMTINKAIRNYLKESGCDLVHLNTSCSLFGMLREICNLFEIKKRCSDSKIVIHFHCDLQYMVKGALKRYIFRKLCVFGDQLISLNKSSQYFINMVLQRDSIIVPNFIDYSIFRKLQNKISISNKVSQIVYVGHVTKEKGCDLILAIAERLPDITFKLVGYISEEIKKMKITKNVTFYGEIKREEVFKIIKNSDLFIFPSHTEGFPIVILEAMSCGMPILSTPVGAIPDILDNKGGVLVEQNDINGFVQSIQNMNKKKREEMSKWNISKVETFYTDDKVISKLIEIYDILNIESRYRG